MLKRQSIIQCVTVLFASMACLAAPAPQTIESDVLAARIDTQFPRVIEYRWKANGATLSGQPDVLNTVTINGSNYVPQVRFVPAGADSAGYVLTFPELAVELDATIKVSSNVLDFAVTAIKEAGTQKVMTVAIPNHGLVSIRSSQSGAAYIGSRLNLKWYSHVQDVEAKLADCKPDDKPVPFTHAVLNTTKLAASIYDNALMDDERLYLQTRESGSGKICSLWCPLWTYRVVTNETMALPLARVVIAPDLNDDGEVDWQDGAIAFRAIEPAPYGAEFVKNRMVCQIAMNFASWAQHPFLRVLDNVKKVYLWTDGMGQEVQFKGYESEGHDSSHPDYGGNVGRRQGGRDELNFVMKRMKDFGARAGIHINCTEYYPEAKHFNHDIADTNKHGWAWLDQSYYTDKRHDIVSGSLYARLDEMRADLPFLDWVYVDVYSGVGWDAFKLGSKMNSLGLPIYTEFPGYMERFVTWNHTSQDWTQRIWGWGRASKLVRFIQNQTRDVWPHIPLLRGANNDGFMGWHSQRDLAPVIRSAFVVNLPSKYLQNFAIRKWTDKRIEFDGGVTAVEEEGVFKILRDGRLLNACRYPQSNQPPTECVTFMPWDPVKETKIYHWNDEGGTTTWSLPASWAGATSVRYYRLTENGRVFVCLLDVKNGKVTVDAEPRTPYVLYKETPPCQTEVVWGEGALVKDPGFDSNGFAWWTPSSPAGAVDHVKIVNDSKGQRHLRVQGNGGAAAEVSQTLYLEGGKTYCASVWVELKGKRAASIAVRPFQPLAKLVPASSKGWKAVRADSEASGAKEGPAALAIDGDETTIWHTQYSGAQPPQPHEIVVDMGGATTACGFYYLPRSGRGNGTVREYAFYLSDDGANWGEAVATGSFEEAKTENGRWMVPFTPRAARYFKFVSLTEMGDQPFTAVAEIGTLVPKGGAHPAFEEIVARVEKTDVRNYGDNCDKYLTMYQRVKVLFDLPKGQDKAVLVLRAEAGAPDSIADFDDVRVVATKRSDLRGHTYFEDFENVDEGCGPFVYGYKGSMRMHLSEAHHPYTDDTIEGDFSLKTFDEDNTLNYRTTPALLKFKPDTKYRIAFDYLTANDKQYQVVVRSDDGGAKAEKLAQDLPGEGLRKNHFAAEFTTGPFGDYYIGMVKKMSMKEEKPTDPKAKVAKKDLRAILVIDNLAVDELPR